MRAVASDGHSRRMLWRAEQQLRELNALLASTNRMASVFSCGNSELTACTTASIPEIWPALSSGFWMSKMALAMIRLAVSPIPIGCTPGFLFKAIQKRDNSWWVNKFHAQVLSGDSKRITQVIRGRFEGCALSFPASSRKPRRSSCTSGP